MLKKICPLLIVLFIAFSAHSQDTSQVYRTDTSGILHNDTSGIFRTDTSIIEFHPDTVLRIVNLNPYFTVHVDSTLSYPFEINKNPSNYFWYLKNSPIGLRINKDNGVLSFKADKSYFLSGRLKYDVSYKVFMGVQNLYDPTDKVDTSFTIVFYNTEIVPSNVKPTVSGSIWVEEGQPITFRVMCETGSFPIENIITIPSLPITDYSTVQQCGDEFKWTPSFDFVRDTDSGKVKLLNLMFIGTTKFKAKDTAVVRVIIRDALNYPLALIEYNQTLKNMNNYLLKLKYTFLQLDKRLKKTKSFRTTFDLTSATTSLTGTILAANEDKELKKTGSVLPSVGLALQPIKEAAVPNKNVDQNQASLIRSSIKRLEYILRDNMLIGDRDAQITQKTNKLRDELKQVQIQLIDVPIELTNDLSEEELNRYFNSPKVNKKYRTKSRK